MASIMAVEAAVYSPRPTVRVLSPRKRVRGESARDAVNASMVAEGSVGSPPATGRMLSPRKRIQEEIAIQEGTSYLNELD